MKGLIKKEWYLFNAVYKKNLILVGLLYLILTLITKMDSLLYLTVWLTAFYNLGGITLDESCGWNGYMRTFPVKDHEIVEGKYVSSVLFTGIVFLYSLIVGIGIKLVYHEPMVEYIVALIIIFILSLTLTGILIACSMKWGVEKSRNTLMFLLIGVFGLFFFLGSSSLATISSVIDNHGILSFVILLVLAIVIFSLSFFAACKIYEKKEF